MCKDICYSVLVREKNEKLLKCPVIEALVKKLCIPVLRNQSLKKTRLQKMFNDRGHCL